MVGGRELHQFCEDIHGRPAQTFLWYAITAVFCAACRHLGPACSPDRACGLREKLVKIAPCLGDAVLDD